jgi:hypothetical protein
MEPSMRKPKQQTNTRGEARSRQERIARGERMHRYRDT